MKWMLIFWICTATCEKEPSFSRDAKDTYESVMRRKREIRFYEEYRKAAWDKSKMEMNFNFNVFRLDIPKGAKVCSAVDLYEVKKSTQGD